MTARAVRRRTSRLMAMTVGARARNPGFFRFGDLSLGARVTGAIGRCEGMRFCADVFRSAEQAGSA